MKILHCHSTFSLGGKEARAVRLMNAFGDAASHTILSAMPDALGARDAIDPAVKVEFPDDAPSLQGKPGLSRYADIKAYMLRFDLVLTYNWGAMDVVATRRIQPLGCPALIHHEDGFNADEAEKLNWKRSLFRRLMLPTASALVVPSQTLEAIARDTWKARNPVRIPNGIDVAAYSLTPAPEAIPGLVKREGDVIVGTLAGLRPVKNLPRLVRAVAPIANARLVIVGEGPEREAILAEARRCGMADRLILPGFLPDPARYIGLFDIFALSSDSEQFPISLIEAMAAGLPAVCTKVGDVPHILSEPNRPFVVNAHDEQAYADRLTELARNLQLRSEIGVANRALAIAQYDERSMIDAYRELYGIGSD